MLNTEDQARPLEPSEAFAELGKIVLGEESLESVLGAVVELAKRVLSPAVEASVTLVRGEQGMTAAFTGQVAMDLDERQYELGAGPCLDAATAGAIVSIPRIESETRWPKYARLAQAAGVRSSLSVALPVQRQITGALNFYCNQPEAFDDDSVELATTFAGYAAVAIANTQLYESTAALAQQMQQAMESRAVIEQAKGVIMRDRHCTATEAFDVLVRLSQQSHRKLRDVAVAIVEGVADPGTPGA